MSLLRVENVSKRYRHGARERVALRGVSMGIEPGELAVVLGTRKSGRSTLLRVAAGLERPDEGAVLYAGTVISVAQEIVGREVCYCRVSFSRMEAERVVDHVAAALLAQRVALRGARRSAEHALERADVSECGAMRPDELTPSERVRVAIARALAPDPKLVVIDDPTAAVDSLARDGILRLLRSLTRDGMSVLMSTDDATCVSGADSVYSLDEGLLRGEAEAPRADVVPLRPGAGLGTRSG